MKSVDTKNQSAQNQPQPAPRHDGIQAVTPQGEQITQLEAMLDTSPQVERLSNLATKMNASPAMAAQRKLVDMIHNSPRQAAQRELVDMIHNSPRQLAQRQRFERIHNSRGDAPVQRYKYQKGATTTVALTGSTSGKTEKFEICTYNEVHYDKGDARVNGTGTTPPADWAGWLIDNGTKNNATQLHVVNAEWGGLGGAKDGNIGPGSQKLNGQHKGPEYKFKNLFSSKGIANYDMTYRCGFDYSSGLLSYNGATIAKSQPIEDPTISADIQASNGPSGDSFGEGWGVMGSNTPGMTIEDGG